MSQDQEMSAIGRLVTRAAESRKRVTLLESELEAVADQLQAASGTIRNAVHGIPDPEREQTIKRIAAAADALGKLAEYDIEAKRSATLETQRRCLGV
jgi:hypothetical protein